METKEPQEQKTPTVEVTVDQGGPIITNTPGSTSANQVQEYWDIFVSYLAKLPDYMGDFFSTYQKPLITVGLIVGAFVTVKVTLAVLDALDDIPLLSPFFELVGIGYSGWFVYRYLLRASNRKELADEINGLKNQVVGGNKTPKV
ncbi:CAAD domain-containing protein [Aerosakkonemataceae cyanobacterium BLCC-F154]|uniref:CAAD domain-containing protein n=1 Tax=Floridaenema fluviatile BLCC-F154 TaxID=3153640 RepID=A0ABV4YBC3_9CYAN